MRSLRTRVGTTLLGTAISALVVAVGPAGPAASAAAASGAGGSSVPASSQQAWVRSALETQYHLGDELPLVSARWVGTHNSFNSIAEVGLALSPLDANQHLDITRQLDTGVRQLELDVHWFPSLSGSGTAGLERGQLDAPVVCHAYPNHLGCSTEKTLGPVLDEIATWLHAHPSEVIFVYLEDHLDNQQGYETAGRLITDRLGSLVYRTPGPTSCTAMPLDLTRAQIRREGGQVLVVANSCGPGADPSWRANVFDWTHTHVEAQPQHGFDGWPGCGPDFTATDYRSTLTRYFEEMGQVSTLTGAGGWPITADMAAQMTKCGVDMISLDQWDPSDPRLASLVWSWAPGQPTSDPGCTIQRGDGRWETRPCDEPHRVGCRTADGSWLIPPARVPDADAARVCAAAGAVYAPPRSGNQNQLLHVAQGSSGADGVWIGYRAGT